MSDAAMHIRESVPLEFDPLQLNTPHITYAVLGGFIVLFGMFSFILREKLYVGEACWAFTFGVIIGPHGANIFNPREWGTSNGVAPEYITNQITLELTRVVLSIGVFAIGVELPNKYMLRHWKSLAYMLGPVMTWGWFVSAGLIYALVPTLSFLGALAVAACLTPTDPILAAAVVGGRFAEKHVPAHIRLLLAAESGCNDGAAFPFLYIALYLLIDAPDVGAAIRDWFLLLWIYQIALGIGIGIVFGFGFRHLMKFCERHRLIDRHSYVAQYLSLAFFTTGVTVLLGSDDLLSTFSCGAAFAWDGFFNTQTQESVFSSVIDLLFNIAAFIYVGAWMPFEQFTNEELGLKVWKLVVLAIGVLVLRRLPIVLMLYRWIPDITTFREALFTGHFGPIGIGAVFISTLAHDTLGKSRIPSDPTDQANIRMLQQTIQPITAFMVLWSIVIHGLSIPSFSLGKRVRSISVSRTWTRERSLTIGSGRVRRSEPEWMDQVVRGGIVRHDDPASVDALDIEKGGGSSAESDDRTHVPELRGESSTSTPVGRPDIPEFVGTPQPVYHPSAIKIHDIESDAGGSTNRLRPPSNWKEKVTIGDYTINIWDEGPHKVIERRKGPGKEVEVEVIRYANIDSRRSEVSHFFSHVEHVKNNVKSYLKQIEEDASEILHLHSARSSRITLSGRGTDQGSSIRIFDPSSDERREGGSSLYPEESVEIESDGDGDEWEDQSLHSDGRTSGARTRRRVTSRVVVQPSSRGRRRSSGHGFGASGMMRRALLNRASGKYGRHPMSGDSKRQEES